MIVSVEIEGLRGIKQGKLENLSALTVLVGPNGCGKSTVLDALLIGGSPITPDSVGRAVRLRQGISQGSRWLFFAGDEKGQAEVRVATGSAARRGCRLRHEHDDTTSQSVIVSEVTDTIGKKIDASDPTRTRFEPNGHYTADWFQRALTDAPELRFLEPASEYQEPLHRLYTRTVEQGRRTDARRMLQEVVPGLDDIEILTDGDSPIIHLVFRDYSVPAVVAGDGVLALTRLVLELASRPKGIVLVEEPEVHQHPRAIRTSARAIWAAVRRDIQVVISTHSLELIDALCDEAPEDSDLAQLSVYRLRLEDGVLDSVRDAGPDVVFARTKIGDDLR